MTDVILAAIIVVPALVTFFLRSDAALSFLALCAGFVLSTSVVGGLKELLNQMDLSVTDTTLALVLIITPLVLTLLLTRGASRKGVKSWLQIIAALGAGGLLALSVGPLVGSSQEFDLLDSKLWDSLQEYQSLIIGVGALVSLILVWSTHLKVPKGKKH